MNWSRTEESWDQSEEISPTSQGIEALRQKGIPGADRLTEQRIDTLLSLCYRAELW